jgi:hypothetical protein
VPDIFDDDDDGDTFNDTFEIELGTDPLDPSSHPPYAPVDTDGDLLPNFIDDDDDNDGLLDTQEYIYKTNPRIPDTDRDRILDYYEVFGTTDPTNTDTDSDGFHDGEELIVGTDPTNSEEFPIGIYAYAGEDIITRPNTTISFQGSSSIGSHLNFSWDFDSSDGIQVDSIKEKPSKVFTNEGKYTVTLTISDGENIDSDTLQVIVTNNYMADLDIDKNQRTNYTRFVQGIDVILKTRSNVSLEFVINGDLETNAIIGITIDSYSLILLKDEELELTFDDMVMVEKDIAEILSKSKDHYVYNITYQNNKIRLLVNIPEFSIHVLRIEKREIYDDKKTDDTDDGAYWPLSLYSGILLIFISILIILILILYFYTQSDKTIDENRYYSELLMDDDSISINLIRKLNAQEIDWEDYDSDR